MDIAATVLYTKESMTNSSIRINMFLLFVRIRQGFLNRSMHSRCYVLGVERARHTQARTTQRATRREPCMAIWGGEARAARAGPFPVAMAKAPDPIGAQGGKGSPTVHTHDMSIMAWRGIQASTHTG